MEEFQLQEVIIENQDLRVLEGREALARKGYAKRLRGPSERVNIIYARI